MKTIAWAAAIGLVLAALSSTPSFAASRLQVVTTTEDLASIAREVGGEKVEVQALCPGYQDPHFLDAKPSFMVLLKNADLFVAVGCDLEVAWAPALLNGSRNPRILPGGSGYVDASAGIQVLEVPQSVSRAQGDVHPLGNPHYWLDPRNGATIATTLRDAFIRSAPDEEAYFRSRGQDFTKRLEEAVKRWKERARAIGLTATHVVTYHRTWSYFADAFGFEVLDYVEPRPGIPPSPNHVSRLTKMMKEREVRLLIMEPFFNTRLPGKISKSSNVPLVVIPTSVGAEKGIQSYFDLFDFQLEKISQALRGSR